MGLVNICVIHQVQEAQVFDELIGALAYGLNAKGHTVLTSVNAIRNDATNIILGTHISPQSIIPQLPANSIIYNTEQVGSIWMNEDYLKALRRFRVWDYSAYNMKLLEKTYGITNTTFAPIGYCPILEKIKHVPEEEKDIDVFMYGSVNERRLKIVDALRARGLKTMLVYDAFGETRDNLIARSRIILNVHYYPTAVMETIRLSYLLNNKCFVVTESSRDWEYCEPYFFTMVTSDYNWIVEDCLEYINAPKRRENVAVCGHAIFKEFKQEDVTRDF